MNYDDRVTIISYRITKDELDSSIKTPHETIVPCYRGRLSHNQQMGLFGKYNTSAFSIHILGVHEGISQIVYRGIPHDVSSVMFHRNSTVVVV